MKKNVDALKALYVALGGSEDDVKNINKNPDMIDAIATIAPTAIASELPEVSATNNGQVLTVVSGEWAAANLPA